MLPFNLLFFTALFVSCYAQCTQADYDAVKASITTVALTNEEWPARLLRAGFHDCLPQSCDGSLALELDRPENNRLGRAINMLNRRIRNTCVSLADAIKLGVEVSMELSGGPSVTCPTSTTDATTSNPENQLPDRTDTLVRLMEVFTDKGFTVRQAVAANVGGHALGRSGPNLFTPDQDAWDNTFAAFLIDELNGSPTPGFNSIQSDRKMVSTTASLAIVQEFADDRAVLIADFQSFLQQMCNM